MRIGIVTVSDRASRGEYEDLGGPAIRNYLQELLTCDWEPVARVISDDLNVIQDTLIDLCDGDRVIDRDPDILLLDLEHTPESAVGHQ